MKKKDELDKIFVKHHATPCAICKYFEYEKMLCSTHQSEIKFDGNFAKDCDDFVKKKD